MRHWQDYFVIGVIVFEAVLAAVINAQPGELGLPEAVVKWLVIANVGLVTLANQFKALGSSNVPPPKPPPKRVRKPGGA